MSIESVIVGQSAVFDKEFLLNEGIKHLQNKAKLLNDLSTELKVTKESLPIIIKPENLLSAKPIYEKVKALAQENVKDLKVLQTKALEILNNGKKSDISFAEGQKLSDIATISELSIKYFSLIANTKFWPDFDEKYELAVKLGVGGFLGGLLTLPLMFLALSPLPPILLTASSVSMLGACLIHQYNYEKIRQANEKLSEALDVRIKMPILPLLT